MYKDLADKLGDDKGITEHLKLPIQRINDYQLLLKELVKYSKRLGEDCTDLQKALELFLGVPNRATDNKFLASIEGYRGNIYKLGRLLTHDWFTVTDAEGKSSERYLFLFKARILVCKVKRVSEDRSVFVLKDIIRLPDVEVNDLPSEPLKFELHQNSSVVTLAAHKEHVKTAWLSEIRQYASDLVALAEHAADDLQVLPPPEVIEVQEEKKKKREYTEETQVEVGQEIKRTRVDEIEVAQVATREESLQQLKAKRKASLEGAIAKKISKSEVVEVSSISEVRESVSTEVRSNVTSDLETKSSVTVGSYVAETGSVTSQSESQQTVKAATTSEVTVEQQSVQLSQQTPVEAKESFQVLTAESIVEAKQELSAEYKSQESVGGVSVTEQKTEESTQKSEVAVEQTKTTAQSSQEITSTEQKSEELVKETTRQKSRVEENTQQNLQQTSTVEQQSEESSQAVTTSSETQQVTAIEQTSEVISQSAKASTESQQVVSVEGQPQTPVQETEVKLKSEEVTNPGTQDEKLTSTELVAQQVVKTTTAEAIAESVQRQQSTQEKTEQVKTSVETTQASAVETTTVTQETVELTSTVLDQTVDQKNEAVKVAESVVAEKVVSSTGKAVAAEVQSNDQTVTAEVTGDDEMSRYSRSSRATGEYSSSSRKLSSGGRYESSSTYDSTGLSSYSRRESGSRLESSRYEAGASIEGGASSRYESKYSSSSKIEGGSKYGIESSYESSKVEGSKYGLEYDTGSKRDSITSKYGRETETTSKLDSIASKYGIESDSTSKIDSIASKYGIETETTSKIDSIASKYGIETETTSKIDSIASKYGKESKYEAEGRSSKYSIEASYDGDKVEGVASAVESRYQSKNGATSTETQYAKSAISNGSISTGEYERTFSHTVSQDGKPVFSKTLEGQNIELTPEERKERNALNAPYFLVALKDTEIMENTYLRFMVKVKGTPNPEVKFFRDGKEIVTTSDTDRISIIRTRADKGCYELVIADVVPADAGKYSCRAINIYGDVTSEATVSVVDDKNIFGELLPGGEGLLAKGEKPTFTWKRDGEPFDPEDRFKVLLGDDEDSLALVFQHVKPEDAGLYTCVAKTSTGNISCSAELTVQGAVHELHREPEKPTLVIEHREAIVAMGGSAMLELQCKGYPKPNIVFKHDGKVVEPDTRHKFLYEDEESLSLVIKNVTSADAGEYHVTASNDLGEDTSTLHLVIKQPPKIKKKIENQSCMVSSTHTVTVEVEGTPSPDVTFYKDGVEIKSSERILIVKESEEIYKITIKDAKLTDSGSYSVVAK
ncbi:obscurin-like [Manduca sexta]|uniref:obscurin-like n=1 Tax=Manduca sexta TaxID=7130 RepID=UPI00188FC9A4|nr:obscurin-like [Manduca sexta]